MVTKRINFLEVSCFLVEVFQLLMGQQGNRTLLQAFFEVDGGCRRVSEQAP